MVRDCDIENNFGSKHFQRTTSQKSACILWVDSKRFDVHTCAQKKCIYKSVHECCSRVPWCLATDQLNNYWFGFRTGHQTSPWRRGDHLSVNEAVPEIPLGSWNDMSSVLRWRSSAIFETTQTSETNLRERLQLFFAMNVITETPVMTCFGRSTWSVSLSLCAV